jgi:hypothetical protein
MIEGALPALASEKMQRLYDTIPAHLAKSPPFQIPVLSRDPTTWPLVSPDMDSLWQHAVDGERALELASTPDWLNMDEHSLCKFNGHLEDTLLFVSSYPTAAPSASVHNRYGTVDDLSNLCMFLLYAKFGFHHAQLRKHGVMHVDIMARRIDRKKVPSGSNSLGPLRKLPNSLRHLVEGKN